MADQVQASHILFMYAGSERSSATRTKEEALALAEDMIQKINDGEAFDALAAEHSDCPSGRDGGNLGAFGRGMMVPEFEDAAFALEVGATSGVVETAFGYHVINRTG